VLRDELAQALAAFANTTIATLRETLGIEATFRGYSLDGDASPRITVAIEATGDLRRVTWVFPVELARELARRMTGEADAALEALAAIELANILTGRGAATLERCGLRIELAPPHITSEVPPGASVRLVTEVGAIEIVLELHRMAA